MRSIARGFQVLGMILLLVGLMKGMERGPDAMAWEFGLLAVGVAIFFVGWRLQGTTGSS